MSTTLFCKLAISFFLTSIVGHKGALWDWVTFPCVPLGFQALDLEHDGLFHVHR